jgi:methylthioribose-1-phosphate isomerase
MQIDVIGWASDGGVRLLDQTRLPADETYLELHTIDEMLEAIRSLRVRGAPLIGVAAAMGLAAAAAREAEAGTLSPKWVADAARRLAAARPTAVDLSWALARMCNAVEEVSERGAGSQDLPRTLREEAQRIWDDEQAMSRAIGEAGAGLIPPGATVLTHCNTGALATGGLGTALAVIYVAHERGQGVHVIATETRPLRQGARLTAWELGNAGIPTKVIVDGAAGALMREGAVDLVITGADRITVAGDAANKIGTYGLAVLAKAHGIPFYIAAPHSTFDLALSSGEEIPIEHRSADEVDAAPGVAVLNPAFDVTPAELITAFVTDRGVIEPPYGEGIGRVMR